MKKDPNFKQTTQFPNVNGQVQVVPSQIPIFLGKNPYSGGVPVQFGNTPKGTVARKLPVLDKC